MKESELESIFRRKVESRPDLYGPLRIEGGYGRQRQSVGGLEKGSVIVELRWGGRCFKGEVEIVGSATPRRIRGVAGRLSEASTLPEKEVEPLVLVPYLSDGIARELERAAVSGVDLNGNYMLLGADLVGVRRDQPNDYPMSRDIKKVYSLNSSIVGRFLLREDRVHRQVTEIHEEIEAYGGGISLSTVSKVLKRFDEDLLISKQRGEIKLLQPTTLLDRLRSGYRAPRVGRTLRLKLPKSDRGELLSKALGQEWVWSGETSSGRYAITTPPQTWVAYALPSAMVERLADYEDRRFYNCLLQISDDRFIYFDSRQEGFDRWVSPVEAYLAMSKLDKREKDVARSIREKTILTEFEDA